MRVVSVTYFRWELTRAFLNRMLEIQDEFDELLIWDNGSPKEMVDELQKYASRCSKIKLILNPVNVGKAVALNTMFKGFYTPEMNDERLCLLDSDILPEKGTLREMERIVVAKAVPVILACEYEGSLPHNWRRRRCRNIEIAGHPVSISDRGKGVAGGCLVMKNCVFNSIGELRTDQSIYGGDEQNLYHRFPGRCRGVLVVTDLFVFHPEDDDLDYAKWKIDTQDLIRKHGTSGRMQGFFETKDNVKETTLASPSYIERPIHSFVEPMTRVCQYVKPKSILEWGPGWSTLLMAFLCPDAAILTIEHDPKWIRIIKKEIVGRSNIQLVKKDLVDMPSQIGGYVTWPMHQLLAEKHDLRSYDLIFVDGRARFDCLVIASQLIKYDGVVIIHDSETVGYREAFPLFPHMKEFVKERTTLLSFSPLTMYE